MTTKTKKTWTALETEGRRRLGELGISQGKIVAEVKSYGLYLTQAGVSFWMAGRHRPDTVMRIALHALYGISPDAWLTREEKELISNLPLPPTVRMSRAPDEPDDLLAWTPIHSGKTATN